MKKQIVKIGDKYAARYKRWWLSPWNYIASTTCFTLNFLSDRSAIYVVLHNSEGEAIKNMDNYFRIQEKPIVIKKL